MTERLSSHEHEWTGHFRLDLLLVTWRCWCGQTKYGRVTR